MQAMCFSSVFTKSLNFPMQSTIVSCRNENLAENNSLDHRVKQLQVFEQPESCTYKSIPRLMSLRQENSFCSLVG